MRKTHTLPAATPMQVFKPDVWASKGSLLPVTKTQVGIGRGMVVTAAIARIRELSFLATQLLRGYFNNFSANWRVDQLLSWILG